jgi:hypothetical protein
MDGMDGGSADHAGAVICRLAGECDGLGLARKAGFYSCNRDVAGLVQTLISLERTASLPKPNTAQIHK